MKAAHNGEGWAAGEATAALKAAAAAEEAEEAGMLVAFGNMSMAHRASGSGAPQ